MKNSLDRTRYLKRFNRVARTRIASFTLLIRLWAMTSFRRKKWKSILYIYNLYNSHVMQWEVLVISTLFRRHLPIEHLPKPHCNTSSRTWCLVSIRMCSPLCTLMHLRCITYATSFTGFQIIVHHLEHSDRDDADPVNTIPHSLLPDPHGHTSGVLFHSSALAVSRFKYRK